MRYAVQVPIAEKIVTDLGEDIAWQIARRAADRAVLGTLWEDLPRTEETLPEHVPTTDPETGIVLPPIRLYRFLYTLDGAA